jgi:hypothetical protein
VAPDLIDDPDDARGSSPEALLQVLSEHRQHSRRRAKRARSPGTRRRTIAVLVAVAAAALLGTSLLIWGNFTHLGSSGHTAATGTDSTPGRAATTKRREQAQTTPARAGGLDKPKHTKPTPPPPQPKAIRVVLTAARNDSWVEVRTGGSTGRVLFNGVVPEGQSVHIVGRRLWARFGSLGNFDVTIDGRAVHPTLDGTVDTVITAAAIEPAPGG